MKITLFTSNQRRHVALANALSRVADQVYVVQEVNSIRPGIVKDFFDNTETMGRYFKRVIAAEETVFGDFSFFQPNIRSLSIKFGDLNALPLETLGAALQSDIYIVFGSSWIRGELAEYIIERNAFNIHMGVAPYYKGSSCNFWACYDQKPELVGATIHRLSKGLDSGDIFYHVVPKPDDVDPFLLGMRAVQASFDCLQRHLESGEIFTHTPVKQNSEDCLRYTRNADFTSEIAEEYLSRGWSGKDIREMFHPIDQANLVRPFWF